MASQSTILAETHLLELRRTIRAPQSRVFYAWTDPRAVARWHARGPLAVSLAESDVRSGGRYRVHMRATDATKHRVSGDYREVDPPKRLVYTWLWDGDRPAGMTLVTLEFSERGNTTEVVLAHNGFVTLEERANHEVAWLAILDKLEAEYSETGAFSIGSTLTGT